MATESEIPHVKGLAARVIRRASDGDAATKRTALEHRILPEPLKAAVFIGNGMPTAPQPAITTP
ncbi:hypothetical protein [Streptomyces jeddahensis]|uniref:Uncharacterized protein n=1 Tax=Streptomyces jeddahensis TaxID=1716141 RepID=A0A177HTN9_9ACTN|nr:hypothetical protein [Streptomyces jeddahensis]OAH14233.1 hypothetical protein STSP_23880 [Streptomyces jeddahensis]